MAETKERRPAVERVKPPEAIIKVGNPIFGWLLRSRLHGLVDEHLMLMRFQGRKTGLSYELPVGRRTIDGRLGVLTNSPWRLNLRGGAPVEVILEGELRLGRADLVENPDEVARIYANLIEEYGHERAGRRLGIRINVDRMPTHEELVDAIERSGLSFVAIDLVEDQSLGQAAAGEVVVTPGVTRLALGIVNAYLVGEVGGPWVLVDAGTPGNAERIRAEAQERFGARSRPEAIVLTHGHADHSDSAAELADLWDVPVYAHRFELPFLTGLSAYPPPDRRRPVSTPEPLHAQEDHRPRRGAGARVACERRGAGHAGLAMDPYAGAYPRPRLPVAPHRPRATGRRRPSHRGRRIVLGHAAPQAEDLPSGDPRDPRLGCGQTIRQRNGLAEAACAGPGRRRANERAGSGWGACDLRRELRGARARALRLRARPLR